MLSALLLILKILGIMVLTVLGLILLAVFLILFVPVRYRFWCSYQEEVKAEVKITWLMHLLSVLATYDQSMKLSIKLLGFPLKGSKKSGEDGKTDGETEEWEADSEGREAEEDTKNMPGRETETLKIDEADSSGFSSELPQDIDTSISDDSCKEAKKSKKLSPKGIAEKIRFRFEAFCDKVKTVEEKGKQIYGFLNDPANRKSFRQIIKMIKHLLPRKLTGSVIFGFEDPSVTGQVCALSSLAYARYGDALSITPVFDKQILEVSGKGKGRIYLGIELFWCVKVLMNQNFRRLLFKRRRKKDGGKYDGRE